MSHPKTTVRVEALIWVLVYAGLLTLGLGLAVQRRDDSLGWALAGFGLALATVGVVLIWLRSRMTPD